MGVPDAAIETIAYYRELKDLAVFRRYAAKFVCEYEMFANGDIADGRPYAEAMARHTGFYHQPESHLFDLVPEFYCADYMLGWLGEAMLHEYGTGRYGDDGCLRPEMGDWMKSLWRQGNRLDIEAFFVHNGLGKLTAEALLRRWRKKSGACILKERRPVI